MTSRFVEHISMRPLLQEWVVNTMEVFSGIASVEQNMLFAKDKTRVVASHAWIAREISERLVNQTGAVVSTA